MLKTILKRAFGASAALALAGTAQAGNLPTGTSDPFAEFATTVTGWAAGPLGVGLSVTMIIVGAGMGIARNSPMPALSGVAGAAFLTWGPAIATSLITKGAMLV